MYNVSNEYKSALKFMAHRFKLRGTVDDIGINDSNVLTGSLSIVKRCSEGSEVKIGSVYTSQLKVTLLNVNVPRNTWKGRAISVEEGLLVGDAYEYVPMGIFYVDEASYLTKGIEVTAYDSMSKLDKRFPANTVSGTAWDVYSMICTDCGVVAGMAKSQIEAFPNANNIPLSMYTENDVETYRDVLSWLAQTLCAFAYADRDGSIKLKQYHSAVDDVLGTKHRFNKSSYSDFITRYTGLSVVDIEKKVTNYYSVEPDDGLVYNLGSNPFLQLGTKAVKDGMRMAILNGLQAIQYSPFEISWSSLAVYDLGDVLQFHDGRGADSIGCIMFLEWKYNKSTKAVGYGSNPALASAKSKTDKNIAGLLSKTDENSIQYYTYMNADEINVSDGAVVSVASLRFTTMNTTKVTFQAEILVDVETEDEAEITVTYMLDGSELRYKPIETWRDGKHILSLWYVIEVDPNTLFQWQVFLEVSGGSVHIDAEHSRAAIWGQGLVSVETWDGYIDVEDTVGLIDITRRIGFISFSDELEVWTDEPLTADGEETVGLIDITRRIDFIDFEDYVLVDKESLFFGGYTWGDVNEEIWATIHDDYTW